MTVSKEQLQQIREALLEAVQECTEHNNEYRYITAQTVIDRWSALARELPQ
jgi:uncharacterized phage-like protein YoqJ